MTALTMAIEHRRAACCIIPIVDPSTLPLGVPIIEWQTLRRPSLKFPVRFLIASEASHEVSIHHSFEPLRCSSQEE
jgi:hypothetical protein